MVVNLHLLIRLMELCDLLSISDGVAPNRYAVAFAKRDKSVVTYIEGNYLGALLIDAFEMCRERAAE